MAIRIAIAGLGNVGRGAIAAVKRNPDMELVAVFSRRPEAAKKEVEVPVYHTEDNRSWPGKDQIDVVILCGGSKSDVPRQGPEFLERFSTVDSFDTHADILEYFRKMRKTALASGNAAIISAGWDPGIYSLERVLGNAFLPGGTSFTVWGPGVSQGHSEAARRVSGVLDARSYTLPKEDVVADLEMNFENLKLTGKQLHRRLVYVVAEEGADKERIREEITEMPNYFAGYETEVVFISQEEMDASHSAFPHGGTVFSFGRTGNGNLSKINYQLKLASNPEFTGSVLVACARAAFRLYKLRGAGAYTMLDFPPRFLSPHSQETLLSGFM